jgi:hypothetical protein
MLKSESVGAMTTRAELRDSLRNLLSDRTQWRDSLLNGWINDAIRDYSHNLPRLAVVTLAMTAGTQSYSIASYNVQTVRLVEYPTGETPRRLLTRLPRDDASFDGGAYYDLKSDNSIIYMGESPALGDSMLVEFDTLHTIPTSDSTLLTVPDRHLELLRLYVVWKAASQLALDENVSVDRRRDLVNALGLNVLRAERAYRSRMREVLASMALGSVTGPWQMDRKDRIY